jgi:hypothetical protein
MTGTDPKAQARGREIGARALAWARANPLLAGAIAVGLIARLALWLVADRRLDDALITIKHAKNVADGIGLDHHLGEGPVHGFTSVLSVLVPLPGELIADGGGLLVIRLVSLAAFVATAIYAHRIARELGLGPWPIAFVLAYLALDQNQIFYGMAGMESQIAVAVLLAGVYYVLVEDQVRCGIALGLACLARPDFVLWVAPAYLFLFLRDRGRALNSALISAAVVLPWLIFATLYYGSPVPNTISAKSQEFAPEWPSLFDVGGWARLAWDSVEAHTGDWTTLAPFLERNFVYETPLPRALLEVIALAVLALALVGVVSTWRRPGMRPAIAFVFLYVAYKFVFLTVGYFEWYGVPILAVIVLLAGVGLQRLAESRLPAALVPTVAGLLALAYAIHIPFTMPLENRVQEQIEDRVRLPLGRYLGEVTRPGETIVTEPSGYVGFYTNATLLDYPGLTSPTVVEALGEHPELASISGMTALLQPDWLVVRPNELELVTVFEPEARADYEVVRRFRVDEEDSSLDRWGLFIHNADREFIVLRRREGA